MMIMLNKERLIIWEIAATTAKEVFGALVNYEERFFICPECGEPIYEEDWTNKDFEDCICPVCEFDEI